MFPLTPISSDMLAEVGRNLPPEGPHQNQDFQSSVRPAKLFLSPSHLYAAGKQRRQDQLSLSLSLSILVFVFCSGHIALGLSHSNMYAAGTHRLEQFHTHPKVGWLKRDYTGDHWNRCCMAGLVFLFPSLEKQTKEALWLVSLRWRKGYQPFKQLPLVNMC